MESVYSIPESLKQIPDSQIAQIFEKNYNSRSNLNVSDLKSIF